MAGLGIRETSRRMSIERLVDGHKGNESQQHRVPVILGPIHETICQLSDCPTLLFGICAEGGSAREARGKGGRGNDEHVRWYRLEMGMEFALPPVTCSACQ